MMGMNQIWRTHGVCYFLYMIKNGEIIEIAVNQFSCPLVLAGEGSRIGKTKDFYSFGCLNNRCSSLTCWISGNNRYGFQIPKQIENKIIDMPSDIFPGVSQGVIH